MNLITLIIQLIMVLPDLLKIIMEIFKMIKNMDDKEVANMQKQKLKTILKDHRTHKDQNLALKRLLDLSEECGRISKPVS